MADPFGGPIKVVGNEMNIINYSMNVLKQWSNTNTPNIIFDSKVDGDGTNNVLHDRVMNKINLYFITFDTNNIFGGYVSEKIYKSCVKIDDNNSFVFSLIRDGEVKNRKYPIKPNNRDDAFYLWNNDRYGYLYQFGYDDICVKRIGDNKSLCQCEYYKYKNEQNPLIDRTHSNYFEAKRIIVIEMN